MKTSAKPLVTVDWTTTVAVNTNEEPGAVLNESGVF